jgi:hypothetical protein
MKIPVEERTMNRLKTLPVIGVLMMVLAIVGCSDDGSVTGPLGSIDDPLAQFAKGGNGNGKNQTGTTDGTTTETSTSTVEAVAVSTGMLDRRAPLAQDEATTVLVGPLGAYVRVRGEAELFVPMGAVDEDVEITLTALAGSKVAFDLQPHGMQFNKPLTLWISKRIVSTTQDLVGVYYDGDAEGTYTALEFFPVFENPSWLGLQTDHFSGYALASGSRSSRKLNTSF